MATEEQEPSILQTEEHSPSPRPDRRGGQWHSKTSVTRCGGFKGFSFKLFPLARILTELSGMGEQIYNISQLHLHDVLREEIQKTSSACFSFHRNTHSKDHRHTCLEIHGRRDFGSTEPYKRILLWQLYGKGPERRDSSQRLLALWSVTGERLPLL